MKIRYFLLAAAVLKIASSGLFNDAKADWEIQHSLNPDPTVYLPACYKDYKEWHTNLRNFWVSDSGEMFCVGEYGVILHRDSSGWHDMTIDNEYVYFEDVWGSSAADVFAVGYSDHSGIIYHYDGIEWSEMKSASYHVLISVWGTSARDVFAVGEDGTIVHFNGSAWTPMASLTGEDLVYVNGTSGTDVFAVGRDGHVFYYDGSQWGEATAGTETPGIWDVWGDSRQDLFAVSQNKAIHFDGQDWTELNCDLDVSIFHYVGGTVKGVYFFGSDSDDNLRVVFHDGDNWQDIKPPETIQPIPTSGHSTEQVYWLGWYEGDIQFFRYDGNLWELIGTEKHQYLLKAVWGADGTDVFAVGEQGMAFHYDGHAWLQKDSGTNSDLNDVWGYSSDNLIAVGAKGVMLRYEGIQWEQVASGTEMNLNAVRGDAQGRFYIVGDGGSIICYDGETCTPMISGTDHDLTGVWAGENGSLYVVGKGPVFLVYNEGAWLPAGIMPENVDTIWGIWGSSQTDIYLSIVPADFNPWPQIIHYDGHAWDLSRCLMGTYDEMWVLNGTDIFSVSSGLPRIYHFDGTHWSEMKPFGGPGNKPWDIGFSDVWGNETDLFVVGDFGTIMHSSRQDHTPPKILTVNPENGATDVRAGGNGIIEIRFSEPVEDTLTVTIRDQSGNEIVPESRPRSAGSSIARVHATWDYGTTYMVTVSSETRDFSGNPMGVDYTWSFTTEPEETPEPAGIWITPDLWIGAQIYTGDRGEIEGQWQSGGEDTTARGDRVIWGYFYADPDYVSWGNEDNPDLFVKIWFDVTGSLYISYFHVSVPQIRVWSSYPENKIWERIERSSTATLSARHIGHFYYYRPETMDYLFQSRDQFENGFPSAGDAPAGNPSGYELMDDLHIGAVINTEDKGPIEGIWHLGGQATTLRGDQVLWGYFYADPNLMSWGSTENPDLFVKVWYDITGYVFLDFFHVSVPDIEVFSELPITNNYDNQGTTILDNRFIEHRYLK